MVKKSEQEAFYELCYYTITHPEPNFIHQYVVDAFAAQTADKKIKPITITFALVGLYLHLKKNFTGKEVQQAHMQLAKHKKLCRISNYQKKGEILQYIMLLMWTKVQIVMNSLPNGAKVCGPRTKKIMHGVINLVKRELWPRKD